MSAGDEAVRANRMDLVARWADDLAHEIKNPLHAMVINLELVKRRAGKPDPAPIIERAEIVEAELHRVHSLIDALLRLVRPWPDVATTDTDALFADILPVARARAKIRKLHYEHHPGGGRVPMPPGDLALVLLNLLDNAIDATPDGGSITTVSRDQDGAVLLSVSDTGPGLDHDEPPRHGRAGLGLAISRKLVQRAGGTLDIGPAEGRSGTIVTVSFPRAGAA